MDVFLLFPSDSSSRVLAPIPPTASRSAPLPEAEGKSSAFGMGFGPYYSFGFLKLPLTHSKLDAVIYASKIKMVIVNHQ